MSIEITFLYTVAASYMKPHIKNKDSILIFTLKKNIPFPELCFVSKPLFYSTSNWQITEEPLEQTNYADRNCMCTTLQILITQSYFFILLLDDYYFWYTNKLIMYSNSFNC